MPSDVAPCKRPRFVIQHQSLTKGDTPPISENLPAIQRSTIPIAEEEKENKEVPSAHEAGANVSAALAISQNARPRGMPPRPLTGVSSTKDMPSPASIERQKKEYARMIEERLRKGIAFFDAQVRHRRNFLRSQAQQKIMQHEMYINAEVRKREMALQQEYRAQITELQRHASNQKMMVEQQAMILTMEYQQKKAQEEMERRRRLIDIVHQKMRIATNTLSNPRRMWDKGVGTIVEEEVDSEKVPERAISQEVQASGA